MSGVRVPLRPLRTYLQVDSRVPGAVIVRVSCAVPLDVLLDRSSRTGEMGRPICPVNEQWRVSDDRVPGDTLNAPDPSWAIES